MLYEAARKIFYTGVGLASIAAEKTGEVVGTLEHKGRQTVREGTVLSDDAKRKLDEMGANVKDVLDGLEKLSREELERVKSRLPELDEVLSKAESTARVGTDVIVASLSDLGRDGAAAVRAKLDELQKLWDEADQTSAADIQDVPETPPEEPAEEAAEKPKE